MEGDGFGIFTVGGGVHTYKILLLEEKSYITGIVELPGSSSD